MTYNRIIYSLLTEAACGPRMAINISWQVSAVVCSQLRAGCVSPPILMLQNVLERLSFTFRRPAALAGFHSFLESVT